MEEKAKAEKAKPPAENEKMNRLNALRERAIGLRDQGLLAPVAVMEYFAAGIDANLDEIEGKLNDLSAE